MTVYRDPGRLTRLGEYLRDHGIKRAWLADQCGVSHSTVTRWVYGQTCMLPIDRALVMTALTQAPPVDLLNDQRRPKRGAGNRWLGRPEA